MNNDVLIKDILFNDKLVQISNDKDHVGNYVSIIVGRNGVGKSRLLKHISILSPSVQFSKKTICISNGMFNKFPSFFERDERLYNDLYRNGYRNLCLSEVYADVIPFRRNVVDFVNNRLIRSLYKDDYTIHSTLSIIREFLACDLITIKLALCDDLKIFNKNEIVFNPDNIAQSLFFQNRNRFRDVSIEESQEIYENIVSFVIESGYVDALLQDKHSDPWPDKEVLHAEFYFSMRKNTIPLSFNCSDYTLDAAGEKLRASILFLNEYNLLNIKEVFLHKDTNEININDLSSGELSVLLTILNINGEIEDGSLVLIDEPELSLHPRWQSEIIPTIMKSFEKVKGCHFIIATHSPLVASSIPETNSSVVLLDFDEGKESVIISGKEIKGRSSDSQLFNILNFPGEHNEYLMRILMTFIVRLTNGDSLSTAEINFISKVEELIVTSGTDDRDPVVHLLQQAKALL
ncbi:AAA family ATPase [Klebsiella pneumoniae]